MSERCFLPPKIAERIPGHPVERDDRWRQLRLRPPGALAPIGGGVAVYSAGGKEVVPGTLLRDLSDPIAREADAGLRATLEVLALLGIAFGRDGLVATVHYGSRYDNAFWDGSEMVSGDGDGQLFRPFVVCVDIPGHELGHGVTGLLLDYQGQAGALNESLSDCLGALVRQHQLGVGPELDDGWLIGKGLFMAGVKGRALRDMLNPGTAFDDPQLGKDDQPAHMRDYVDTSSDNGGVHTNSGIPNRAFALAARAVGDTLATFGVWHSALLALGKPAASFADFARATIAAAPAEKKPDVQSAWVAVGVLSVDPTPEPPTPPPAPGDGQPLPAGCFPVGPFTDRRVAALRKVAAKHGFGSSNEGVSAYLTHRLGGGQL